MKCLNWNKKKKGGLVEFEFIKKKPGAILKKLENFFYAEKPTGGPSHR